MRPIYTISILFLKLCRHLYLEICKGSLDTYILEGSKKRDFQWTVLPDMCFQLVDSVAWLHQSKIFFDGRLHPRNIFVKFFDARDKVKLLVPDRLNPFNNMDVLYTNIWSNFRSLDLSSLSPDEQQIKKDKASVAITVYFIQSLGYHPFQPEGIEDQKHLIEDINARSAITENIQKGKWRKEVLNKSCYCTSRDHNQTDCVETECKYRSWVNSLASDWTDSLLTEIFAPKTKPKTTIMPSQPENNIRQPSLEKLKHHPFFWKVSSVLNFIEKSWSYLKERAEPVEKIKFGCNPVTSTVAKLSRTTGRRPNNREATLKKDCMKKLRQDGCQDIINYLHEYPDNNMKKDIDNYYELLKQIRNKVFKVILY